MTGLAELDLPVFAYDDPELRGPRYHDVVRELRAEGWLATSPLATVVLDREAGEFFLRSKQARFPGREIAELFGVEEGTALREEIDRNILHLDGDAHRRLRNLVNPAFSPKAAARWRPVMREFIAELWEGVAGDGRCDAVEALAQPYPALTIARVVGAPRQDAADLWRWSNLIQRQFDPPSLMESRDEIEAAVVELYAYLERLLAARRAEPQDDLVSQLLAVEGLTGPEATNLILNALVGGVDTTQSQLAHALALFAQHPEQWQLLGREPERVADAVEELVRFEPITPFTARLLHEEVEYRDVTFPAGTVVMVCAFTGNRDGVDGGFDITADRSDAKPLTFGAGIHYCLGANLARAELQEALAFLPARMPGLALDGEPELGSVHGIYGLDSLPIRWNSA